MCVFHLTKQFFKGFFFFQLIYFTQNILGRKFASTGIYNNNDDDDDDDDNS